MNAYHQILLDAGLKSAQFNQGDLAVYTPIDGTRIADVITHSSNELQQMITKAKHAHHQWRSVPAPRRGELLRLFGDELRTHKAELGRLVSLECGKIFQEGLGEVQEMIDICDLSVGQSRQLFGLTIASERPGHTMRETWHAMGVCGVITAFNFPVAVFAWNTALALITGNTVVWKPSEKTPLTALAVIHLFTRALKRYGDAPDNLVQVAIGEQILGEAMVKNPDISIISATGSTRMGRMVSSVASERFARCILELGGNNAMIVSDNADIDMALLAIVFSAVGTCGQRCTSLRRLIVHENIYEKLLNRLKNAYKSLRIGDPLQDGILLGPLIDEASYIAMQDAISIAQGEGATLVGGTRVLQETYPQAYYVSPAILQMPAQSEIVKTETFAPILYVMSYKNMEEAIAIQNDVKQGLSSCLFTQDLHEAELFLSAVGSDCGIANINIGPSGAEIGGAFGGEKETGGGRESGSDAWKGYMRRQTNTINYSHELPLAQGVEFELEQ